MLSGSNTTRERVRPVTVPTPTIKMTWFFKSQVINRCLFLKILQAYRVPYVQFEPIRQRKFAKVGSSFNQILNKPSVAEQWIFKG